MERMNGEVRDREKVMRGLKRTDTAVLTGYQIYHNYFRPHEALNDKTPTEKCGVIIEGENKWKPSLRMPVTLKTVTCALEIMPVVRCNPIEEPAEGTRTVFKKEANFSGPLMIGHGTTTYTRHCDGSFVQWFCSYSHDPWTDQLLILISIS
jgi:hypothetical protein